MGWAGNDWQAVCFLTNQVEARWWMTCRNSPGVYRLVALKQAGALDPEPLNRVCGTDETGTIYIGKANDLKNRVAYLVMQHHPDYKTRNHVPLTPKMASIFKPDRLGICWQFTSDIVSPRKRETDLLNAYQDAFGELPPLNSQG